MQMCKLLGIPKVVFDTLQIIRRVNHSISVPVFPNPKNYLLNNHTGLDGDISNTVTEGSDSQA
jgi:hypothetical protein